MKKQTAGNLLAAVGVIVMLLPVGFYYWRPQVYAVDWRVCVIGAVIGFVGFDIRNPAEAKAGAGVLVDGGVRFINALRGGSRAEDRSPVPTVVLPVPQAKAPVVTEEHDG